MQRSNASGGGGLAARLLILIGIAGFGGHGALIAQQPEAPVAAAAVPAQDPVLPAEARAELERLHAQLMALEDGAVADYIPELARVEPDQFGIAIVTVGGEVIEVGDTRVRFTIQSVSKPFVYGLTLRDHGREELLQKVGAEPTGLPFNSVLATETRTLKTQNPLVNAGAIAVTSLIVGKTSEERFGRVRRLFERLAGEELEIDADVFRSEMATNSRNLAIANLLDNYGLLYGDVEDSVTRYTRACSLSIDARQLATMGATLANGGVQPITGEEIYSVDEVTDILSVMAMAGLYDGSGRWLLRVGLPAKSGVGGGIVAVVPGRFAIATFAPRLDADGNSVRGRMVVEQLSAAWQLHLLRPARRGR